jgi:hypothetical protein
MQLKTGQYVRHSKYGWGTIVECDRTQTLVLFRSIGIKRIETGSANFDSVGSLAPKKKHPR